MNAIVLSQKRNQRKHQLLGCDSFGIENRAHSHRLPTGKRRTEHPQKSDPHQESRQASDNLAVLFVDQKKRLAVNAGRVERAKPRERVKYAMVIKSTNQLVPIKSLLRRCFTNAHV